MWQREVPPRPNLLDKMACRSAAPQSCSHHFNWFDFDHVLTLTTFWLCPPQEFNFISFRQTNCSKSPRKPLNPRQKKLKWSTWENMAFFGLGPTLLSPMHWLVTHRHPTDSQTGNCPPGKCTVLGGGKCLNLGVGNVRILGVVNVLLANDSQSRNWLTGLFA